MLHRRFTEVSVHGGAWFLAIAALASMQPRAAIAWNTAEHVRFGQHIAQPFEERLLGERVPVIDAPAGPRTFAHWVSAPDFGRGMRPFLEGDPVIGDLACSAVWNSDGVIDGEPVDDQSMGFLTQRAYLDCLDTWRMNNSHFGDFAAYHYAYYHDLSLEAARRYRVNRQPVCRQAAYTLEAWAEHYLTDSTAAGHAWNPAGTYDAGFDWQTTNSLTQRMRIHNHFNDAGARYGGALYELGVVWGDDSAEHLAQAVPELADDPQRELTLHLARMSLGQVTMRVECGGPVAGADVLAGGDPFDDPRQVYVSDESMCDAMYGAELGTFEPDFFEDLGVDDPNVLAVVDACRDGDGVLAAARDGVLLARRWFQDKYYQVSPVDGEVSPTLDPLAILDPADLGCGDQLPVLPVAAGTRDACGMLVCEHPPGADGACPPGMAASAACCFSVPALGDDRGAVTATPWRSSAPIPVELGSAGAIAGESSEFLWVDAIAEELAAGTPVRLDQHGAASLPGGGDIARCGTQAAVTVHDTRVRLPRADVLATTELVLEVSGMDEGLRIEVDGRAVRYLTQRDLDSGPIEVPLFGQALPARPDGTHLVRLVHLNDCGSARPLEIHLQARGSVDTDDPGDPSGGCGCRTTTPSSAGLFVFALLLLRRRRSARSRLVLPGS